MLNIELFFQTQYNVNNQGRCGECGDQWALPRPRHNDEGGLYGNGIIVASYTQGSLIPVDLELPVNHGGWMEFRLCADKTSPTQLVTQDCLDKNLLEFIDGTTRYVIGRNANSVNGPRKPSIASTCRRDVSVLRPSNVLENGHQ